MFRLFLIVVVFSVKCFADMNAGYPELMVTPRASERIQMEAKVEHTTKWSQHLPLEISALATLTAGLYSQANKPDEDKVNADDAKWARNTAIGVGAAWLLGSYFLTQNYSPYTKANTALQAMPNKTPQEMLTRERVAEEQIDSAARLGDRLMWASTITNLGASAYLAGKSSKDGAIVAGVSGILALAPLFFKYNWQTVSQYHQEYKKKIYGPIALPTVLEVSSRWAKNETVPGVQWLFSF